MRYSLQDDILLSCMQDSGRGPSQVFVRGKRSKSTRNDQKATGTADDREDGVRVRDGGYSLVSDEEIITKLDDRTSHDSRTQRLNTGGSYKTCDLEEESRLRDEVVDAMHRQRMQTDAETDRNDPVKTGLTARKALRTQRLQHALERAGQFVGGKEEIDVASELDNAEAWTKQHLRPWIWTTRSKRYRKRLEEVPQQGRVCIRFNGLPVDTLMAAKKWITQLGIQTDETPWSHASFQVRRLRSGGRIATELMVEVGVSKALRQLFIGREPSALFGACASSWTKTSEVMTHQAERQYCGLWELVQRGLYDVSQSYGRASGQKKWSYEK